MLNPNPNVIWAPGIGLIGIGGNKKSAALVADIAVQNIQVINKGEALGGYFPIKEKDQLRKHSNSCKNRNQNIQI